MNLHAIMAQDVLSIVKRMSYPLSIISMGGKKVAMTLAIQYL
jgi:hypothetical protein